MGQRNRSRGRNNIKAERYGGVARRDLKDSDFVIPKERAFPIMTRSDVGDAVSSWGRYRGDVTFDEFKKRLTILAKRKGLGDALPEAWRVEVKIGRRNSASDTEIMKAMYKAMLDYTKTMKMAFTSLGIKIADEVEEMIDDIEDNDEDEEMDEETDDEMEVRAMNVKAIDLNQRCEMVCDAIADALEEINWVAEDEDALEELGDAREAFLSIHRAAMSHDKGYDYPMKGDEYKEEDDDDDEDYEIYVYDEYAVLDLEDRVYRIDYEIEGGMVILADPEDWMAVEWNVTENGGKPFVEAENVSLSRATKSRYEEDDDDDEEEDDDEDTRTSFEGNANELMREYASERTTGTEIKTIAEHRDSDIIGGYAVLFGDPNTTDLSPMRDFFTVKTDFMLDGWDKRPMLYHHAMEANTKADPIVGHWIKARVDDLGVWVEGELKKNHQYYAAIKELIKRGALLLSSDSAAHLVDRQRLANGTHFVKRWGLIGASLTPAPAEPRMMPVTPITRPSSGVYAAKSAETERDTSALDSAAILRLKLELQTLESESLNL